MKIDDLIDFVSKLPLSVYALWVLWLGLGAALLYYSVRIAATEGTAGGGEGASGQQIVVESSPGTTVYQAGRDINVISDPSELGRVESAILEARLTCTLREGAEPPPSEVTFIPIGDSHAYLEGGPARVRLSFQSPVRFRLLEGNRVVVINRFSLDADSYLQHRPVQALTTFGTLSIPIVTVVYGETLSTFTFLEVTLYVNGETIWYAAWEYDQEFQQGPRFSVSLDQLHQRLKQ